jgi:hypothetical protein
VVTSRNNGSAERRARRRTGLEAGGPPCPESQADGVPCEELGADCQDCDRADPEAAQERARAAD